MLKLIFALEISWLYANCDTRTVFLPPNKIKNIDFSLVFYFSENADVLSPGKALK